MNYRTIADIMRRGMTAMLVCLLVCIAANLLAVFHILPLVAAFATHGCLLIAVFYYLILVSRRRGQPEDAPAEAKAMERSGRRLLALGGVMIAVLALWGGSLAAAMFLGGAV